jgi:catechol 2,3-dioxygenase-like lactoylglutathione lyase family enzyme
MILGVHHIGLSVCDIGTANWLDHVGGGPQGSWVTCPNVHMNLASPASAHGKPTTARPVNLPGIAHICLQSRDIDEGLARGIEAGLVPVSGPVDLGTEFRYLYAHTRDGILLELEGAPFASDLEPRFWVGHVAFVAKDIVPLVAFYGRVLGLTPSPLSRLNPNALFDKVAGLIGVDLSAMWLPGLNLGLEFWQYHNPPVPVGHQEPTTGFTRVTFECNDFAADVAHVLAQGATPEMPSDFGLTACKTASFKDPEGNPLSLIEFEDSNDPMSIQNLPHLRILDHIAAQRPSAQKV